MRRVLFFTVLWIGIAAADSGTVRQGVHVLWRDPGPIETLDFRYGAGGAEQAPRAPFTFVDEDLSGSTPKIKVRDANGRDWAVKFGDEAHSDTFGSRMAWALGYFVAPTYLVPEGTVQGVRNLRRASKAVDDSGRFRNGRFQLRSRDMKFLKTVSWSWSENPFLSTPELQGLKILMMLLSNWDNKDIRDAASRGTNTAIFEKDGLLYYFVDDWGGSMGKRGKVLTRNKWDHEDFLRQSVDFVQVADGKLQWDYVGQHSTPMKSDIRFSDIAWLMQYLGRISDEQLRTGLLASGASEESAGMFVKGLRMRINQLRALQ